ncbi:ATP-dependent DNA ligase [Sphingosinicella sp. BN140058]|uniref:ATP-dependent DNA ligase n=1 Tax=Sphingosinicella sp. BN140058 TaxID=1892855 RepID=UPI001011503E|nr:ATP-dependent DNA ligase [Sphingosinicella sp. BN140058]QAY76086.1 ATP-dependent DNA ligase [Sphingosinicella sp. BN140058]
MAAFDSLSVKPGLPPMEAKLVDALPEEPGWRFEPKWDGFRCLVFRDGGEVHLQSKAGKPLGRYFPEIVESIRAMEADRVVLDGELIIPIGGVLSFDALQLRLHPAESRIRRLAAETPAQLMLFDLLHSKETGYRDAPLAHRRRALEIVHGAERRDDILLSPYADDRQVAQGWLDKAGGALDGVVAKRTDAPYQPGERAMLKIKQLRTADCVVGGFRYATNSRQVGSLLLGLFNDDGKLDHVGFTSAIPADERTALTERLEALIGPPGFTGDAPGGPSRWSTERTGEWEPLRHELIAEVRYDHVTGNRFRHGTKFLRWRPDKVPEQCRMDQLQPEARPAELAGLRSGE